MQTLRTYKVGGWVRDKIRGVKSKDLDIVVEGATYEEMRQYILERVEKPEDMFLEEPQFCTIRAKLKGGQPADYALTRKDGEYLDGRRPISVSSATILEDLGRRDFRMNAIALCEDGAMLDPYSGIGDIQNQIIQCVGVAHDRFSEDSLRLVRAIRFHITLGFKLSKDIVMCLADSALIAKLDNISKERTREELAKCFSVDTYRTLQVLSKFSLLRDKIFEGNFIWLKPTMEIH